jgi:hypothetical protein
MSARPTGDTDKRRRSLRRLQLGGDTGVGLELLPKFDREKRANAVIGRDRSAYHNAGLARVDRSEFS